MEREAEDLKCLSTYQCVLNTILVKPFTEKILKVIEDHFYRADHTLFYKPHRCCSISFDVLRQQPRWRHRP